MSSIVDVHTHIYPPAYISLLRSRSKVPYMRTFSDNPSAGERLVILPSEDASTATSRGRPIGPEYYDENQKISFMDTHNIDISVISLANPWLDWCEPSDAANIAQQINDDVEAMCTRHPNRLYAFGTLPLSAGPDAVVKEINRLKQLNHMKGVILGTSGLGKGLDDPSLNPVWQALESTSTLVFLHPHYGLPTSVYGDFTENYGHVLPLALGFPMETTIAVTRLILSGVFDKLPSLQILLAHSGGTLPFLAGRIESCIAHDAHFHKQSVQGKARKSVWDVLNSNVYLDAVVYGEQGLKNAVECSGTERMMFGTDHPFFPPLDGEEKWLSVGLNESAVDKVFAGDEEGKKAVMGGNAIRVLGLDV